MKSKTRCLDCNATIDDDDTRCKRCERAIARSSSTGLVRGETPEYHAAVAKLAAAPPSLCYFCRASHAGTYAHVPMMARHASPAHWVGRLVPACAFCRYQRDPAVLR